MIYILLKSEIETLFNIYLFVITGLNFYLLFSARGVWFVFGLSSHGTMRFFFTVVWKRCLI